MRHLGGGVDGEADRAVVGVCQRVDLDAVGDAPQDQIRQDPDAEPAFCHSHDRKILPRRKPDVWLHVRALQQVGDLGLPAVLQQQNGSPFSASIGTLSCTASVWPTGRTTLYSSCLSSIVSNPGSVGSRRKPQSTRPSPIQLSTSS